VSKKDVPRPADVDWTFGGAWPYRPHWFTSRDGRMHYIDEGPRDGRPVVLVHGNPTWGFVYRNFVSQLASAGHRVIVPDHLGFGRSDKPGEVALCQITRHIERFDALLESLDLYGATVDQLLDRLRQVPDTVASVMVIGHNPGLQELTVALAREGELRERAQAHFPTAALATLALPEGGWAALRPGEAVLAAYVAPREL